MNYDSEINKLAEAIKADKSIVQPWRNKAVARLEESQAFVRMGKSTSTLRTESNPVGPTDFADACTCPSGALDTTCPVHGGSL